MSFPLLSGGQAVLGDGHLARCWERLQGIPFAELPEWPGPETDLGYFKALVWEWFERVARWKAQLSLEGGGIFCLAQNAVGVLDRAGDVALPEAVAEWLCGIRREPPMYFRGASHTLYEIEGTLFWSLWRDHGCIPDCEVDDPYEPFLQFLELGGWIYHEHGTITEFHPAGGSLSGKSLIGGGWPEHLHKCLLETSLLHRGKFVTRMEWR